MDINDTKIVESAGGRTAAAHHPGANPGQQLALTQAHRDLMIRLTAYVRFNQF